MNFWQICNLLISIYFKNHIEDKIWEKSKLANVIMMKYLLIIFGLLIDFFSLGLYLRVNRKACGSSGIPIISLIFYVSAIYFSDTQIIFGKGIDLLMFLIFHILIQFFVPYLDRRLFVKKQNFWWIGIK